VLLLPAVVDEPARLARSSEAAQSHVKTRLGTVPAKGNLGTELATPPLCKSLNTNGLPRWPEGPPA